MTEPYPEDTTDPADVDIEAPEDDVREQQRSTDDDSGRDTRRDYPLEADPADAADQDRDVPAGDDDEYR